MIKYDPENHHRHSIRLKDFDYSRAGAYFVTICTYNKKCMLGNIINDKMHLNKYGSIFKNEWLQSPNIRTEVKFDKYIIMPNHFHAIIFIFETHDNIGAYSRSPVRMKPKSLSSLMSGFKSSITSKINTLKNTLGLPVLQRNYYEHIIRNENELNCIREYILNNPLKWQLYMENPDSLHKTTLKDYYKFIT